MGRKTKEQVLIDRRERVTTNLVNDNKYLSDSKYYKNNFWSWAAWDSWAAKGTAGSCVCGCGYYNGTLKNTRSVTKRGGSLDIGKRWPVDISPHLCYDCVELIHKKIGIIFKKH